MKTRWLESFCCLCLWSVQKNSCSWSTSTAPSLFWYWFSACGCGHWRNFAGKPYVAGQCMTKLFLWKVRLISPSLWIFCNFEDISRRLHPDLLESCVSENPKCFKATAQIICCFFCCIILGQCPFTRNKIVAARHASTIQPQSTLFFSLPLSFEAFVTIPHSGSTGSFRSVPGKGHSSSRLLGVNGSCIILIHLTLGFSKDVIQSILEVQKNHRW